MASRCSATRLYESKYDRVGNFSLALSTKRQCQHWLKAPDLSKCGAGQLLICVQGPIVCTAVAWPSGGVCTIFVPVA
jgi:hypothetical protein